MKSISFYDQKEHLLQCTCGFVWKAFIRDYRDFEINDQECPSCCRVK